MTNVVRIILRSLSKVPLPGLAYTEQIRHSPAYSLWISPRSGVEVLTVFETIKDIH